MAAGDAVGLLLTWRYQAYELGQFVLGQDWASVEDTGEGTGEGVKTLGRGEDVGARGRRTVMGRGEDVGAREKAYAQAGFCMRRTFSWASGEPLNGPLTSQGQSISSLRTVNAKVASVAFHPQCLEVPLSRAKVRKGTNACQP